MTDATPTLYIHLNPWGSISLNPQPMTIETLREIMGTTKVEAIAAAATLLATTGTSTYYAANTRYLVSVELIGVGWFASMVQGIQ